MAGKHNPITVIAFILLVIGGLNWGLVGIGNFMGTNLDLVQLIFGGVPTLRDIIYILVGLSAIWKLIAVAGCKECKK